MTKYTNKQTNRSYYKQEYNDLNTTNAVLIQYYKQEYNDFYDKKELCGVSRF